MRWIFIVVIVIIGFGCKPIKYLQRSSVQLSKPVIKVSEVFFERSTTITISPTADNAEVVYSESENQKQKYKKPIVVRESAKISAHAFGGGFIPSDSTNIEVLKLPKNEIISITSKRPLNEKYGDGGTDLLIDRKKGSVDFNEGWLGYAGDTIVFDLEFDIIDVNHLIISTLRSQGAWIFSPAQINVYLDGKLVSHLLSEGIINEAINSNVYTKIDLPKTSARQLKVEIIAPNMIPSWHVGVGSKPWIFIDEILIY